MTNFVSRSQSKTSGDKYYFTGQPCKRGHIAQRLVSNMSCVECVAMTKATRDKAYYVKNKDKVIARVEKWVASNREHVRKYHDQYYQLNADHLIQASTERYADNKDAIRVQQKQYYDSNRKQINARNLPNVRKRQLKISQATPIWFESKAVKNLYELSQQQGYDVHHIVPLHAHPLVCGLHCLANLVPIPKSMHTKLHGDVVLLENSWSWDKALFSQGDSNSSM